MRSVTVYGIREKGGSEVIYVGATTDLQRRKRVGYSSHRMKKALSGIAWEYVTLEMTDVANSVHVETEWVDKLRAEGHVLRNVSRPSRLNADAIAPQHRSGPGGKTDLVQARLYLSEAEHDAQKALAKGAGLSWSTWARRKLAT